MHVGSRWYKDDDEILKLYKTQKEKQNAQKNCTKRPWRGLLSTYHLWYNDGKTWIPYLHHATVSLISFVWYNKQLLWSMPKNCIYYFFAKITRLLSYYTQSVEEFSYWTPWIGQRVDTKNSQPSKIVSKFPIFHMYIMLISIQKYTHID